MRPSQHSSEPCYVATQCTGKGSYRGEWTEWSSSYACPPPEEGCSGKKKVSFRRCVLPAVFGSRLMPFRCPEDSSAVKVERCPCGVGVWSEWSGWTICSPHGDGTRIRRRICVRPNGTAACPGTALEVAVCPAVAAFSVIGHPRIRKVRGTEDIILEQLQANMMKMDDKKSILHNLPRGSLPITVAGFSAATVLMCIVVLIRQKYLQVKGKRKAKKVFKRMTADKEKTALLSSKSYPSPPLYTSTYPPSPILTTTYTSAPMAPYTSAPTAPYTSVPAAPYTSVPAVPSSPMPSSPYTPMPASPYTPVPASPLYTSSSFPLYTSSNLPLYTCAIFPIYTSSSFSLYASASLPLYIGASSPFIDASFPLYISTIFPLYVRVSCPIYNSPVCSLHISSSSFLCVSVSCTLWTTSTKNSPTTNPTMATSTLLIGVWVNPGSM
ncbi:hypothetical protein LSH36_1279g00024 [Paralvinella palmiformis]|uniref:Uncharacterized protein n=1 Tax=Paralvinella palmiformis TaxID=53620 RepID=A0AAD9IU88_9ANNE|nr:hypothetical protein LSH36_1279g00024 [Paralvinella palmiformis]